MPPGETASSFNGIAFGKRYGSSMMPDGFAVGSILESPRYKELDRRQSYFEATQHDGKQYDFDGRVMQISGPGAMVTQPFLTQDVAPYLIPLRMRRPSAPYRLPKVIVNAYTNLIFGNQRFPNFRVQGDEDTQDYAAALSKASNLETKMIRARNLGGSVGSVGISWCFDRKGRPRVEVHNAKHLYVHEWDDREEFIARWVSEVYLFPKDEWDGVRRRFVKNWYWHRRDFTEEDDVLFEPVLFTPGKDPLWTPDPSKSITHGDGFCHLNWIQNIPSEEIDGLPDYHGLYENFDVLDILLSVISKGAILNLDPTLVLKIDADIGLQSQKGSDHSLIVGVEGGAEYLELTGQSLDAGVKLFNEKRRSALEVAQCVVPDPSEIAAQGVSSISQKMIYRPMLGQGEILRAQYGAGLTRILEQMIEVARIKTSAPRSIYVKQPDGTYAEKLVQLFVDLPKKVVTTPIKETDPETGQEKPALDDQGKPQKTVQMVDLSPGNGTDVELDWPDYFPATPADQTAAVTALTTANGGKPVLSQQTSVEQAALLFSLEGADEWERVQKDGAVDQAKTDQQNKMFADSAAAAGGKPGTPGAPPPPKLPPPKFGGSKPPFGGGEAAGGAASDSGPSA